MPKTQFIDPAIARAPGFLEAPKVPLCQYATPIGEELTRYGKSTLVGVLEDKGYVPFDPVDEVLMKKKLVFAVDP